MEARIDVLTPAVADLERSLGFYRDGLGLKSGGVIGTEFAGDDVRPAGAVAMFELRDGLILALWPRTELARDANVPPATPAFSSAEHRRRSKRRRCQGSRADWDGGEFAMRGSMECSMPAP